MVALGGRSGLGSWAAGSVPDSGVTLQSVSNSHVWPPLRLQPTNLGTLIPYGEIDEPQLKGQRRVAVRLSGIHATGWWMALAEAARQLAEMAPARFATVKAVAIRGVCRASTSCLLPAGGPPVCSRGTSLWLPRLGLWSLLPRKADQTVLLQSIHGQESSRSLVDQESHVSMSLES